MPLLGSVGCRAGGLRIHLSLCNGGLTAGEQLAGTLGSTLMIRNGVSTVFKYSIFWLLAESRLIHPITVNDVEL